MDIQFTSFDLPNTGALVVFCAKDKALTEFARAVDAESGGALSRSIDVSRFSGAKGQALEVTAPAGLTVDRVLLLGVGDPADLSTLSQAELGASVTAKLGLSGSTQATILADFDGADAASIGAGALLRSYRFDKYRTKESEDKKPSLKTIFVAAGDPAKAEAAFEEQAAIAAGVSLTKDLTSEVPNVLHPESYAEQLKALADLGVDVEVLGEAEMADLGMEALLGVGQGSVRESKMVIMRWNGGNDQDAPLAFVGKGVTFDTGGISLKPGDGMDQMKWDMGGSAIVCGLMKALAGRKAPVNVIGVVGLVENMPDGNAQRPGDVVTSMSGQTIEILNTDAEGRLVLADALWYTQDRFKPRMMIDLATLTGAMIISLGHEYAGFFTDSDEIADALHAAGATTGDKTWRLPLHSNYDKLINTPTADMKNIGGRAAGSITAAQFLKRYTNNVPWAHIDVAGTVWSDKPLPLSGKGATGYGVRLLDDFVRRVANES